MVGSPKSLADLRRIEAAVQLTCESCRHRWVRDREELIAFLLFHRKSIDWQVVPHELGCEKCGKSPVRMLPLPFTTAPGRAVTTPGEMIRVNLALLVLREAAEASKRGATGTSAVRLALRVVAPYVRDTNTLREFWRNATEEPRSPWLDCFLPYRWIVTRMVERGYAIWAENRL